MIKYSTLLAFLFAWLTGFTQNYEVNFVVNARVDTTNTEVNAVLNTWIGYLKSKPDSVYDNPYWNSEEKKKYEKFDFTQGSIYQFPAEKLLQYFKLTILSITKEDSSYAIRTLFYKEGLEGDYARSNPWCIIKIYAVKENGEWKLHNALDFETKNWTRKKVGKITYVFSPEYNFNETIAIKANNYCDSIARIFSRQWEPFTYYITHSSDELGELMGFDFFFAGVATGLAFYDARMLFSSFGTEWYPHEFVHLVIGTPDNKFVSEGIATWLGGSINKTFQENVISLSEQVKINDSITFWNVFDKKWGWQYNAFYTSGAIICDLIYKRNGMEGIKKYYDAPNERDEFIQYLSSLLGLKRDDIDTTWKEYLKSIEK